MRVTSSLTARIGALDEDAQIALVVENLEKLHPGIRGQVEGGGLTAMYEATRANGRSS